jgi:hypothetical protein
MQQGVFRQDKPFWHKLHLSRGAVRRSDRRCCACLIAPKLPSLALPVGQNTQPEVNRRPQKYSILPKFDFGVFMRHLIPVRGADRDRHERGMSRGGRRPRRRDGIAGRATVSERHAHTTGAVSVR